MIDAALTREIEDAFAVDPSPQFAARVFANRPERRTWRFSWTFVMAASAAAAAIVAAVLVMPGRRARTPAPVARLVIATLPPVPLVNVPAPPETPRVAAAPSTTSVASVVPVTSRPAPSAPRVAVVQSSEPEVLFAKDESAALQRLMRGITRGAVDPATLSEPTTAIAAIQPRQIVLAPLADVSPITIEPFGSLVEGVRQ
jgi:hypothetical protein